MICLPFENHHEVATTRGTLIVRGLIDNRWGMTFVCFNISILNSFCFRMYVFYLVAQQKAENLNTEHWKSVRAKHFSINRNWVKPISRCTHCARDDCLVHHVRRNKGVGCFEPRRGPRNTPRCRWFWFVTVCDPCSKGDGQVARQGVLDATERFMARWHEEEAKKSRRCHEFTMGGVGEKGAGGDAAYSFHASYLYSLEAIDPHILKGGGGDK